VTRIFLSPSSESSEEESAGEREEGAGGEREEGEEGAGAGDEDPAERTTSTATGEE